MTTKKLKESKTSSRKVSHRGAIKKGKDFEREVANIVGHIFPEAKRNLEYQPGEGNQGKDIGGTDRIIFQCKNHQGYVSISTIREIQLTSNEDIPVLVTKGNRLEPMAVLPFDKFVTLLEIAYGLEAPFPHRKKKINTIDCVEHKEIEAPIKQIEDII